MTEDLIRHLRKELNLLMHQNEMLEDSLRQAREEIRQLKEDRL